MQLFYCLDNDVMNHYFAVDMSWALMVLIHSSRGRHLYADKYSIKSRLKCVEESPSAELDGEDRRNNGLTQILR